MGLTFVPRPQPGAAARLDLSAQAKAAGAGAPVSGKTVARQVDHAVPAVMIGVVRLPTGEIVPTADAGSTGGGTISVTSHVVDAGQLFERVGVHYRAARGAEGSIFVEIRASSDGAGWTEWQALHVDDALTDPFTNTYYIEPAPVPQTSRLAQYRVWLTGGDPADLRHLALTFLDVNDLNAGPIARLFTGIRHALADGFESSSVALAAPTGPSKVLTRADWAADETRMKWTPKYVPWQKALVHHTVTADGGTNVAAEIRSMYYFHAVTRGWGDIGYNHLVDKFGNIWIGRQGGDNVVAGHAYGWNDGTLGIAAIGDFSVASPTGAMQGAIANVVALKFKQLGIQPYGNSAFTHEEQRGDGSWTKVTTVVANMIAHRDASYVVGKVGGQTACPGNRIYNMLDGLRGLAQNGWTNGYTYLVRIDPLLAPAGVPGQAVQVPVTVRNLGTAVIPAGTLVSYRVLRSGSVVMQGSGVALAQPIAAGAVALVTVPFVGPPIGEYVVRWDLQTGGLWWSTAFNTPFRDVWFRSADWSADWISDNVSRNWTAGETRTVTVTVKNDGGRAWNAAGTNPVRLGYYWISNATGNRFDGQAKLPLPYDVMPGQTITLTMPVVAPVYPTNYTMWLDLHKENEFWFRDKGLAPDDTPVTVSTDFKAQYTLPSPLPPLGAGKTALIPVQITNAGRGTFPVTSLFPVNLGYHWYDAAGKVVTWDGARTKLPADLLSGQSVTLQAEVTPPATGGTYDLRFDLVQEGIGWFSDKGVITPRLVAAVAGPVIPVYAAVYQPGVSALAQSGGLAAVPFTITNKSNFTWSPAGPNPVTLSYHWLNANGQVVVWDGKRTRLSADVAPGQSAPLMAQVAFPATEGTYRLRWDLVHEGIAWFSSKGVAPLEQVVVVGPPPFYGGSMDVSKVPSAMAPQLQTTVPLRVQNMSNFAWDTLVNLSYHWYDAAGKVVVWDGLRTPLAGMAPKEVRSISAVVEAPRTPGSYTLRFDIVQEGVTWFSGKGMLLAPIQVAVEVPPYGATYAAPATLSGAPNLGIVIPVSVTNTGSLVWQPGVINLSYHVQGAGGAVALWDGQRSPLVQPIAPGQTAVVNAFVKLPAAAGSYVLTWDLVREGVTWFSGQNVRGGTTALVAQ
ncbi:MAG: N-acetylmuramoyl-L-alanine amidase [Chloroflexi bacterium]|nr:N-acetylmuramoyl-L-alanine amidase [Chloroflexota bacterium]